MKPKIDVSTIGYGRPTYEEKMRERKRREILMAIGMFPTGYDGGINYNSGIEKRLSPDRFSSLYKSREEFEHDRSKILAYIENETEVPQDILDKVSKTVKELDLKLGE